ncbi:MAG: glycosyltransferase family 2 protein [Bacteroidetes bacterium]|nr:glycosyltransferase family 2 protein [Bacteroidota bacterium]MBS1608211.1 glycosyltransferase family 2 protein [Bacteroidota bacterium]
MPKVAIVILNWNGRHYLQQFLPSVLATTYQDKEVIVADNASTDDSIDLLKQHYPSVTIIQHPQNFGYAKGYNEALKQVNADYFVLLNSDVQVQSSWIEPMVALLESDKTIAACQPKVLSFTNKELFEYAGAAGGWMDRFGYPFAKGRIFDICEKDKGQYDKQEAIFWASGAALFIRASAFHRCRGFDEFFFAHQEEIDLCWRLQLSGFKIYSCPQSIVYHVGGGTLPKGNSKKTFLNFRNNHIALYKNLPWSQKWWKIPFRIFLDIISAFKGLLSGDGGYFLAIFLSHFAFLKWIAADQDKSTFPESTKGSLQGYYRHNIVWQHFINRKRYFGEIIR